MICFSSCVAQVTATTTTSDAAVYTASGFSGTLGKPFTLEALRAVLATHLGSAAAAVGAAPRAGRHRRRRRVLLCGAVERAQRNVDRSEL